MQVVKNIFIGLLVGWFFLLAFMPKQELYYKLEQELEKNNIKINEKSIESGLFSLKIHDADIYIKGMKLITIGEIDFFTLLFYTSVNMKNVLLDESLKTMTPTQMDTAILKHDILNPIHVGIDAKGSFGSLSGMINLNARVLHLDFNDSKGIEQLKPKLLKDEKGWYYETSF